MKPFVPMEMYDDEDISFTHVNPNVIANAGIVKTNGSSIAVEFPVTVETVLINREVISYLFPTEKEAKVFIKKIGGIK